MHFPGALARTLDCFVASLLAMTENSFFNFQTARACLASTRHRPRFIGSRARHSHSRALSQLPPRQIVVRLYARKGVRSAGRCGCPQPRCTAQEHRTSKTKKHLGAQSSSRLRSARGWVMRLAPCPRVCCCRQLAPFERTVARTCTWAVLRLTGVTPLPPFGDRSPGSVRGTMS